MGKLLTHRIVGDSLKIQIFNDNANIKLTKFKDDQLDFRFLKFLNHRSKNWIQLQTSKTKELDFLFPIMTQIVVIYEDVYMKQKYLFMSYVQHKLIRTTTVEQTYEYLENSQIGNIE